MYSSNIPYIYALNHELDNWNWGSQGGVYIYIFFLWRCDPMRVMASSFLRFLDHTQRRNTVGRTPVDEWSARRRDLYLTTHNTHKRQTSMPPVGFELTISVSERPQTYALDRAATGTGIYIYIYICVCVCVCVYIYIYIYICAWEHTVSQEHQHVL